MLQSNIKSLFSLAPNTTYLNHGGFGAVPVSVGAAKDEKLKIVEANPTRFFGGDYSENWNRAREKVAERFGLKAGDTALVDNITEAANAVLRSFPLKAGDNILITSLTYGSLAKAVSYIAWRNGATVTKIEIRFPDPHPQQIVEAVKAAITPRTRLALFDHIAAPTAMVMPLAEMAAVCRANSIAVLVDGAHVPGNIAFDVAATGADWYAANLHKWYFTPRGCGFLWAAPGRQKGLVPAILSWNCDQPFPACFEWTGTRDPGAWLAIPEAFAFMDQFGEEKVREHNHALLRDGMKLLSEAWKTPRPVPESMLCSMGLLRLPDNLPYSANLEGHKKLERDLREQFGITAGFPPLEGGLWIRVSAQIYNEIGDYEKLAKAILKLK